MSEGLAALATSAAAAVARSLQAATAAAERAKALALARDQHPTLSTSRGDNIAGIDAVAAAAAATHHAYAQLCPVVRRSVPAITFLCSLVALTRYVRCAQVPPSILSSKP